MRTFLITLFSLIMMMSGTIEAPIDGTFEPSEEFFETHGVRPQELTPKGQQRLRQSEMPATHRTQKEIRLQTPEINSHIIPNYGPEERAIHQNEIPDNRIPNNPIPDNEIPDNRIPDNRIPDNRIPSNPI